MKLVSVTSNEPDNGLGDGDTANDIVIQPETGAYPTFLPGTIRYLSDSHQLQSTRACFAPDDSDPPAHSVALDTDHANLAARKFSIWVVATGASWSTSPGTDSMSPGWIALPPP